MSWILSSPNIFEYVVCREEIEADDEFDLVELPLESEKSLFDLIITECSKFQTDFQGEGANSITTSTVSNDPRIIEEHWSHRNYPLKHFMFTLSKNDCDDNDGDRRVLECNGCIQPITVSHPSYYAWIQCSFFLHSFCATKLPRVLSVQACPVHPQHQLVLGKRDLFYDIVKCGACTCSTNGFYYHCKTCEVKIDTRCAFLPTRIKHKSHKNHSLVQRPISESVCSVSFEILMAWNMHVKLAITSRLALFVHFILAEWTTNMIFTP